ncbi:hypothetical protein, partial [Burkholderia thailandensis]|uniref:hypothetical protein n=1 Tax=Burkholderia thailandensis TaxID=57975 RepID=UPI00217E12D8
MTTAQRVTATAAFDIPSFHFDRPLPSPAPVLHPALTRHSLGRVATAIHVPPSCSSGGAGVTCPWAPSAARARPHP